MHTFRTTTVAAYDLVKGATDTECRVVAEGWMGMTAKYSASTKLALRLIYSIMSQSCKVMGICRAVKFIGGVSNMPSTMVGIRRLCREDQSMNSRFARLGKALRESQIPLGGAKVMAARIAATPMSKSARSRTQPVMGKYPDELRFIIQGRAATSARDVDHLDFLGSSGIPAALSIRSRSTVGKYNVKDTYIAYVEKAYNALVESIPPRTAHRSKRLDFWLNKGHILRLDKNILHVERETTTRPAVCFWCAEKRPRTGFQCLFCGEVLCSMACLTAFHSGLHGFAFPDEAKGHEMDVEEADNEGETASKPQISWERLAIAPTPIVKKAKQSAEEFDEA